MLKKMKMIILQLEVTLVRTLVYPAGIREV